MLKILQKKIEAVFKSKADRGQTLTFNCPYGYIKDPNDKRKWLVDDEASVVIKDIYRLCMNGLGITKIANILNKKNITPPAYHKVLIGQMKTSQDFSNTKWDSSIVLLNY